MLGALSQPAAVFLVDLYYSYYYRILSFFFRQTDATDPAQPPWPDLLGRAIVHGRRAVYGMAPKTTAGHPIWQLRAPWAPVAPINWRIPLLGGRSRSP